MNWLDCHNSSYPFFVNFENKMLKKTLIVLYVLTIIVLAAATIIEHGKGTEWVAGNIYGAPWFSTMWAALAAFGVAYIIRRKMRNPVLILLHAAFVVILAGALVTHLTAAKGMLHIRQGDTTSSLMLSTGSSKARPASLPFTVKLESFEVTCHSGTSTASDYSSHISLVDGNKLLNATVSMNRIFSYRGYRFYQTSFDSDSLGAYLTVYHDPWGIAITYTGYALLFFSLVFMLLDRKGTFRSLLRSPLAQKGLFAAVLAMCAFHADAASVIPKESAAKIGKLEILYNGRIAPVQTFALDFTEKIYGHRTYHGLSAEQVLTGWIFFGKQWDNEPVLRIKDARLRKAFGLQEYASVRQLLSGGGKGYVLAGCIEEYYAGNRDKLHKAAADIDDKLQLILSLRQGSPLHMFPVATAGGKITWFAPTDSLPLPSGSQQAKFIGSVFAVLNANAQAADYASFNRCTTAIRDYQGTYGAESLPSVTRVKAELTYNAIPFATILFMFNLTVGLLLFVFVICRLTRPAAVSPVAARRIGIASVALMALSFAALSWCEALRWVISGNIPLANGYETMLLLAWLVMLISLVACRKFPVIIAFGFLLSGFFLLVSHISQMDPHITPMMPVLSSPLLSVHVSVIMMSYALVSLTFICSVTALVLKAAGRDRTLVDRQMQSLQLLSRIFLYPALTTMGLGIFIGAVWANVSWGQYWTWDPKETWALITFMTYAVAAHTASLPALRRPVAYHAYLALAFIMLIMTYFGVNYFLEGMHSYA